MRSARVFQSLSFAVIASWLLCGPAAAARLEVIYSFNGAGLDGIEPTAGVIADSKGVLYGTTPYGGQFGAGTVFSLTPPKKGKHNWKFQTLYSFQGGTDGSQPVQGLVRDHNGVLYGTVYDMSNGVGGVFTLRSPAKAGGTWKKTTIFQFTSGDGLRPLSTLVLDANGALYGTTTGFQRGDPPGGAGVVYKLTPPAGGRGMWQETVLYDPNAVRGAAGFVGDTLMGVAVDQNGNVFGTSASGVADGSVFELADGTAKVLFPFGGSGGVTPLAPPILDPQGNLYGTTWRGGGSLCPNSPGCGTAWKLTPTTDTPFWNETLLHDFAFFTDNTDGTGPGEALGNFGVSPLLRDNRTGTLYGSTLYGGTGTQCGGFNGSCGTLFQVDRDGNYSVLWEFPDGGAASPQGHMALFKGAVYGTTYDGGVPCSQQHYLGCGTVFKLTP